MAQLLISKRPRLNLPERKRGRGVAKMDLTMTYLGLHGLYLAILAVMVVHDIRQAKRGMKQNVKPTAKAA
jgi:hypothetical protein